METFGIIYKVTNKINGKIYIGQTVKSLAKRKSGHLWLARKDNTHSIFLRAINKYGEGAFDWAKICDCYTREELDYCENYYINFFKTNNLDKGYNLVKGRGRSGYEQSKDTKDKISKKAFERLGNPVNNPMYGKQHSEETKTLISDALKGKFCGKDNPFYGKKHTKVSRSKMSENRFGIKNHFYGKHLTASHRNKISEANKGRVFTKEHRKRISDSKKGKSLGSDNILSKIYIITFPDGRNEVIKGLSQFCKDNGLSQGHMSSCANGKRKSHKGFKCAFYMGGV